MELLIHTEHSTPIAEILSDTILLKSEQDAIRLLEEIFSSGAYKVILHQENIDPGFFDLSTGFAGAVLQKFVNYDIQLAIIGDFHNVTSKSLRAFIWESNQGHHICFSEKSETAIRFLLAESQ